MGEWICASCINYPPSSTDGKPCCMCEPGDPLLSCYQKAEAAEINVFDECEVHENCTVEIWKNSITGEVSVGWWEHEEE